MNRKITRQSFLALIAAAVLLIWLVPGADSPKEAAPRDGLPSVVKPSATGEKSDLIAVAPPPFSEGIFPCSECHSPDDEVDATPRLVDFHETVVFEHDAENRWCLDCHSLQDRDKLHLADGRLIGFEESYRLCGQCHGPHLRDWKAGDHGKRTGYWSGQKEYLLCAHCHDPHSPKIKPVAPMPPPIRQEELR